MQWLRLEERYRRRIAKRFHFGRGVQFQFPASIQLSFPGTHYQQRIFTRRTCFVLNDEVHLNFGKEIIYNYFDQNRFFVGLSYQTGKMSNLQFGYMNVFQQLAAGNRYKVINARKGVITSRILILGKSNPFAPLRERLCTFAQNRIMINIELERVEGDYGFEARDANGHRR